MCGGQNKMLDAFKVEGEKKSFECLPESMNHAENWFLLKLKGNDDCKSVAASHTEEAAIEAIEWRSIVPNNLLIRNELKCYL